MLEHRAPLDQLSRARNTETLHDADAGLRVTPVTDRGLLLLQGAPEDAVLRDAIGRQIGARVPGPQTTDIRGEYALLWMTPKEWLLELPAAETSAVQGALVARLAPSLAAITDISDALACFDIGGDPAMDVLMTGCSLDLRPHAFAAGRVARTAITDVHAIIWKPGIAHPFRCWVDRSFAEHFWNWLADSPARW